MPPTSITALTSVPNVLPEDPTLSGKAFRGDGGNAIEIFGSCSAGSGKLYLFRHNGSGEWYPVDIDSSDSRALPVDSTKPTGIAGLFSGTWMTGDRAVAWYCVVAIGGPTLNKLFAATRRL